MYGISPALRIAVSVSSLMPSSFAAWSGVSSGVMTGFFHVTHGQNEHAGMRDAASKLDAFESSWTYTNKFREVFSRSVATKMPGELCQRIAAAGPGQAFQIV